MDKQKQITSLIEWHDLRQNPDDLPPTPAEDVGADIYLVLLDHGSITDMMWHNGWNCCVSNRVHELKNIVMWAEMPRIEL